jgi:hypothetical protein
MRQRSALRSFTRHAANAASIQSPQRDATHTAVFAFATYALLTLAARQPHPRQAHPPPSPARIVNPFVALVPSWRVSADAEVARWFSPRSITTAASGERGRSSSSRRRPICPPSGPSPDPASECLSVFPAGMPPALPSRIGPGPTPALPLAGDSATPLPRPPEPAPRKAPVRRPNRRRPPRSSTPFSRDEGQRRPPRFFGAGGASVPCVPCVPCTWGRRRPRRNAAVPALSAVCGLASDCALYGVSM